MAIDISRRNSEFEVLTPQLGTHFLNTRVPWTQCQTRGALEKRSTNASIMPLIFFLFLVIFIFFRRTPDVRRKENEKDTENDTGSRQILPRGVGLRRKPGVGSACAGKLLF